MWKSKKFKIKMKHDIDMYLRAILRQFIRFIKIKMPQNLRERLESITFAPQMSNGTLAERLGNGLQNRVEQFDSARYLTSERD